MPFAVTSESFKDGDYLSLDHILAESYGFGCAGKNISPQLSWSGAPEGTKSFALTCYDPDAPTGSGFWHWVVANIPPDVTSLDLGASGSKMPAGSIETRPMSVSRGTPVRARRPVTTRTAISSPSSR